MFTEFESQKPTTILVELEGCRAYGACILIITKMFAALGLNMFEYTASEHGAAGKENIH